MAGTQSRWLNREVDALYGLSEEKIKRVEG